MSNFSSTLVKDSNVINKCPYFCHDPITVSECFNQAPRRDFKIASVVLKGKLAPFSTKTELALEIDSRDREIVYPKQAKHINPHDQRNLHLKIVLRSSLS